MTAVAAIISAAMNPIVFTTNPHHPFTAEDFRQSRCEGWDIVKVGNSFQLQSLCEGASYKEDATIWQLVWKRAREGSKLHQKTLDFLIDNAMSEYIVILQACQTH